MSADPDLHLDRKIFGPGIIMLCAKYNKFLSQHPDEEHIRSMLGYETSMDETMDEFASKILEYLCRLSDDMSFAEDSKRVRQEASKLLGRVMKILGHAVTQGILPPRVAQIAMARFYEDLNGRLSWANIPRK